MPTDTHHDALQLAATYLVRGVLVAVALVFATVVVAVAVDNWRRLVSRETKGGR